MASTEVISAEQRIFVAGFGGQGVLTMGKLLCLAAMNEGKEVTFLPSYGAEVRGGTAHCHVVVSPELIFSPIVEAADSLVILNELSFDRFGEIIRPGGLLVVNSSLVDHGDYERTHEATVLPLPATERATEMGNVLVANVLLLGALVEATDICRPDSIRQALRHSLTGRKSESLALNLEAFEAGAALARRMLQQT
jgi:2-oxoglutarate ferredoxin oxidoreductase subunit gamma